MMTPTRVHGISLRTWQAIPRPGVASPLVPSASGRPEVSIQPVAPQNCTSRRRI